MIKLNFIPNIIFSLFFIVSSQMVSWFKISLFYLLKLKFGSGASRSSELGLKLIYTFPMNNCNLKFSTDFYKLFFFRDKLYSHPALSYIWHSLADVRLQFNVKYVLPFFFINNRSLEGRGTGIDQYLSRTWLTKENIINMCSPQFCDIIFCTCQMSSLAYGKTSGQV